MFAKLAVTAALCGAIVMGGTEAKKKGPTITNKVFFDIEIGARPPRPPSRSLKDKQGGPLLLVWPKTGALELRRLSDAVSELGEALSVERSGRVQLEQQVQQLLHREGKLEASLRASVKASFEEQTAEVMSQVSAIAVETSVRIPSSSLLQ